jgi:hypothetical protein
VCPALTGYCSGVVSKRSNSLFLLLVLTVGCASSRWQPLDPGALAVSQPRAIVFALMSPGDLLVTTSGSVGGVSAALGRSIVAENAILDPGLQIGRRLVAAFARSHELEARPERLRFTTRSTWDHYNVDLVLVVRTESWSVHYLQADSSRYGFAYHASVELHDTRRRLALARGDCDVKTPPEGAPTHKELFADHAERLREAFDGLGDQCLRLFAGKLLGVSLPEERAGPPRP